MSWKEWYFIISFVICTILILQTRHINCKKGYATFSCWENICQRHNHQNKYHLMFCCSKQVFVLRCQNDDWEPAKYDPVTKRCCEKLKLECKINSDSVHKEYTRGKFSNVCVLSNTIKSKNDPEYKRIENQTQYCCASQGERICGRELCISTGFVDPIVLKDTCTWWLNFVSIFLQTYKKLLYEFLFSNKAI